jgi:hypothetical protein
MIRSLVLTNHMSQRPAVSSPVGLGPRLAQGAGLLAWDQLEHLQEALCGVVRCRVALFDPLASVATPREEPRRLQACLGRILRPRNLLWPGSSARRAVPTPGRRRGKRPDNALTTQMQFCCIGLAGQIR